MRIAISLPKEDFLFLEKLKARLKVPRSRLIQQAIEYWLASRKEKELISRYEAGYIKKPEKISHISNIEKPQYGSLSKEGW